MKAQRIFAGLLAVSLIFTNSNFRGLRMRDRWLLQTERRRTMKRLRD